jgi:hypothetical protein
VGGVRHPQHTQTGSVEQFPDVNKLCDVASCWIYEYIGLLLGARPVLHISRLKVNSVGVTLACNEMLWCLATTTLLLSRTIGRYH